VNTHIVEEPVEETVNLHEEHVEVKRRPVNRAATSADFDTFQEGTMEFTESREEAVIDKQAHVSEEVVIQKEERDRQETVRDTVRHTEVDVDRVDDKKQKR
jgi:stress response protein YsnF